MAFWTALSNASWLAPGTLAFNSRWLSVIAQPSGQLFERNGAHGFQAVGRQSCLSQLSRKCHGEAAGVRGSQQFFRIRALAVGKSSFRKNRACW